MVNSAIQSCEIFSQRDFYDSIRLFGGGSMFRNFGERLDLELRKIIPKKTRMHVSSPPERYYWYVRGVF